MPLLPMQGGGSVKPDFAEAKEKRLLEKGGSSKDLLAWYSTL